MNEPERRMHCKQPSVCETVAEEAVGLLWDSGGEVAGLAVDAAQTGARAVGRDAHSAAALAADEVPAMLGATAEAAGEVAEVGSNVIGEIIGSLFS